jgi:sec-independent protein translocase protein TatA
MGEFSLTHWLIILAIMLIFFGPSRLPQLGQSLGKALRGFKEGLNEKEKEANDANARIESPRPEQRMSKPTAANRAPEHTQGPDLQA